ncbi:integral membrane protein MviN [Orientia chuto str. Dubai]|uniref:Probable lipid II flippase MurJ n=1 Tax=Orientia chuto str. Dubai TaxID=1359168 RepID=A0A0F3MK99_9RICK|nr:murein biosynthesis integral membrane protein MurJ [Candidatus Orientia mediorientalis]KJV56198.1 integral membrane protein MviN [Orientia chuto str. Dubai]
MKLLKSSIVVAILTIISRISGFLRELFIASLFGVSELSDSVLFALKLPNLMRIALGEKAFFYNFVSFFSAKLIDSRKSAEQFASNIFTIFIIFLIALVIFIQLIMPCIIFVCVPGFLSIESKMKITILLCRITIFYTILASIVVFIGEVLNSIGKFTILAFSPVFLNLFIIVGTYFSSNFTSLEVAICCSVIIAGFVQVLFMYFHLRRARIKLFFKLDKLDESVKSFGNKLVYSMLSSGVSQVSNFISQGISSFFSGGISVLSYADRIYQLPLAIVGISINTVLLPELSKLYKQGLVNQAAILQKDMINFSCFLALPTAVIIGMLSNPITELVYQCGTFTIANIQKISLVITISTIGLPTYIIAKVITPVFYANHDTKTPMQIAICSSLLNIILSILLMQFFGYISIVLSNSISLWVNIILVLVATNKYGYYKFTKSTVIFIAKLLISCIIMAVTIYFISNIMLYNKATILFKIISLLTKIVTGGLAYLISCFILKVHHSIYIT